MKKVQAINRRVFSGMVLVIAVIFWGCSGQTLSTSFDKEEVIESAEMIVDLINAGDVTSLIEHSTPRLRAAITGEVWEDVFAAIGEGGTFISIDSLHVRSMTDRERGEAYAVVTARARYEHKTFTYTISFTEEMALAGLYYR